MAAMASGQRKGKGAKRELKTGKSHKVSEKRCPKKVQFQVKTS